MNGKSIKILSVLTTITILLLLIMAGPAQAFTLWLISSDQFVRSGQKTNFFVSAKIESNEKMPITKFSFVLDGSEKISCEFSPNGTIISGCKGMTIKQISDTQMVGYGYCNGYGYGYNDCFTNGTLSFNITANTKNYKTGIYSTKFITFLNNEQDGEKTGDPLFIVDKTILAGCSVRANGGSLDSEGENKNSRNKLSFSVPLPNAAPSDGSLQAQGSRKRITYGFEIIGALSNDINNAQILVNGDFRENRNANIRQLAVINLDKKNKVVDVAGKNMNIDDMDATLMERCK